MNLSRTTHAGSAQLGTGAPARPWAMMLTAASMAAVLCMTSGCAALVVAGAVGVAKTVADRRASTAQIDDNLIEYRARARVGDVLPDRGHVNATSYNGMVLITGEVPTEGDKAAVEAAIAKVDKVKSTVNDLAVRESTAVSARTNDTVLTTKVKGVFAKDGEFPINAVTVVTERGVVYLMGLVTEAEGNRAAELARSVSGVMKVVKVFETKTPAELDRMPKGPAAS
jgi:osmotically-inducible protein OsmY